MSVSKKEFNLAVCGDLVRNLLSLIDLKWSFLVIALAFPLCASVCVLKVVEEETTGKKLPNIANNYVV